MSHQVSVLVISGRRRPDPPTAATAAVAVPVRNDYGLQVDRRHAERDHDAALGLAVRCWAGGFLGVSYMPSVAAYWLRQQQQQQR